MKDTNWYLIILLFINITTIIILVSEKHELKKVTEDLRIYKLNFNQLIEERESLKYGCIKG